MTQPAPLKETMMLRNEKELPAYRTPEVQTMADEEILEAVGPAQAYTGNLPFGF